MTRRNRKTFRYEHLERRELLTAAPATPQLLPQSDSGADFADGITNLNNTGTWHDDLSPLSDEFDNPNSRASWQRVNEIEGWHADQLQIWDVDETQPGRMVLAPETTSWYQDYRGPMAFKTVTGDFVFSSRVHVTDRDDIGGSDADDLPSDGTYSLAGMMIRTPRDIVDPSTDWQPGSRADDGTNNGENYIFLSLGWGASGDEFQFEVKTTRNSNSQLQLRPAGTNVATLQIARIGDAVIVLRETPSQGWRVHERYYRPDLPETLQVGLVSYTDWEKANDYSPFFQNSNTLNNSQPDNPTPQVPFNPDIMAGYEYARFARPQLPAELANVDLIAQATDQQLLSFLGATANLAVEQGALQFQVEDTVPGAEVQLVLDGQIIGRTTATSHTTVVPTDGTTTLPDGNLNIVARQQTPGDVLSDPSVATVLRVDTTAPQVTALDNNTSEVDPPDLIGGSQPTSWSQQRSELRTLSVLLDDHIQATIDDITLTRVQDGRQNTVDEEIALTPDQIQIVDDVLTLDFSDSRLPDGNYRLELTDSVRDLAGNPLDGDQDGVSGGTFLIEDTADTPLYQLTGDFNGDRGTSIFDLPIFSYWFGEIVGTAPRYVDLNGDDGISIFDFSLFAQYFGDLVSPVARGTLGAEGAEAISTESAGTGQGNEQSLIAIADDQSNDERLAAWNNQRVKRQSLDIIE